MFCTFLKPACVLDLHPNLEMLFIIQSNSSFTMRSMVSCWCHKVRTKPIFTSDSSEVMIPFKGLIHPSWLCANSPLISFNSWDRLLTSSSWGQNSLNCPFLASDGTCSEQLWSCQPSSTGDFVLSPSPLELLAFRELWRWHSHALAGSATLPSRLKISAS